MILRNRRGQPGLWGYAISGDLPIVLLQIGNLANIDLVRQLLRARGYWRLKGLVVDLVIWTEDQSGYRQQLHDEIMGLIAAGGEGSVIDRPGGVFVRPPTTSRRKTEYCLLPWRDSVVVDSRGRLADQARRRRPPEGRIPLLQPSAPRATAPPGSRRPPRRDLVLANEFGGFTRDGREYVMTWVPGPPTPAPWINVLANPTSARS